MKKNGQPIDVNVSCSLTITVLVQVIGSNKKCVIVLISVWKLRILQSSLSIGGKFKCGYNFLFIWGVIAQHYFIHMYCLFVYALKYNFLMKQQNYWQSVYQWIRVDLDLSTLIQNCLFQFSKNCNWPLQPSPFLCSLHHLLFTFWTCKPLVWTLWMWTDAKTGTDF